jgi:hypothetical protein
MAFDGDAKAGRKLIQINSPLAPRRYPLPHAKWRHACGSGARHAKRRRPHMDRPMRKPEEILAYRPLEQILASKPQALWSVGPADKVPAAIRVMADKNIGFLLVLDHGKLVGVLSERDCARRIVLSTKPLAETQVAEIMTRNVITRTASPTACGSCISTASATCRCCATAIRLRWSRSATC